MFTGIVEEIGTVGSAQSGQLTVLARKVLEDTQVGDSIAVNGVCLTVVRLDSRAFSVDIMPETLHRTNLGELRSGDAVNLERALSVGGRLGGHFVQGHIDGVGKVISLGHQGEAVVMRFGAPPELMRYVVEKGFIAVDGVSLTAVERSGASFTVSLVAYTRQNTTLGRRRAGDKVNLEVDILAKYVEQLGKGSGVTLEFLAEHGFVS